jgi:glutamine synthetase
MVQMARIQILPAALQHQTMLAQAVSSLEAAGVKSADQLAALKDFVALVGKFRDATIALEKDVAHHDDDPFDHAEQIQKKVRPAIVKLREYGDQLEQTVTADLWPLPTYQEMLFLR